MRHTQALGLMVVVIGAAAALLAWLGSLWGALAVLVCGLVLMFVIGMAWLWAPRSGMGRGRRPTHDSFSGLP